MTELMPVMDEVDESANQFLYSLLIDRTYSTGEVRHIHCLFIFVYVVLFFRLF